MATIAIIDLAHCGTTMTAGILERLGVPMVGERYDASKREDWEVIEALQDEYAFAELVARRDGRWGRSVCSDPECPTCNDTRTWGFKYPGAWKFARTLRTYLRDPVYFAIYKDAVSVTRRRFGTISAQKLRDTVRQMESSIAGIEASGLPVEWLSYQDAIVKPRAFADRLARLAGLGATQAQLDAVERYIRPEAGYPPIEGAG